MKVLDCFLDTIFSSILYGPKLTFYLNWQMSGNSKWANVCIGICLWGLNRQMSGLAFVYSNWRMSGCSLSIGACPVGECLIGVYGYTLLDSRESRCFVFVQRRNFQSDKTMYHTHPTSNRKEEVFGGEVSVEKRKNKNFETRTETRC